MNGALASVDQGVLWTSHNESTNQARRLFAPRPLCLPCGRTKCSNSRTFRQLNSDQSWRAWAKTLTITASIWQNIPQKYCTVFEWNPKTPARNVSKHEECIWKHLWTPKDLTCDNTHKTRTQNSNERKYNPKISSKHHKSATQCVKWHQWNHCRSKLPERVKRRNTAALGLESTNNSAKWFT